MSIEELIEAISKSELKQPSLIEHTKSEYNELNWQLNNIQIIPMDFDVSLTAWLYRINRFGKVTIKHFHPEKKIKRKKVSEKEFVKGIADDIWVAQHGMWQIGLLDFNEVQFTCEYIDNYGRKRERWYEIKLQYKGKYKKYMDKEKKRVKKLIKATKKFKFFK